MKMKTKKAAAKRFRLTASGKIKFKRATLRHILAHRSRSNKLPLKKGGYVHDSDAQHVLECMPYGYGR